MVAEKNVQLLIVNALTIIIRSLESPSIWLILLWQENPGEVLIYYSNLLGKDIQT